LMKRLCTRAWSVCTDAISAISAFSTAPCQPRRRRPHARTLH
jgi:hypothetical protein